MESMNKDLLHDLQIAFLDEFSFYESAPVVASPSVEIPPQGQISPLLQKMIEKAQHVFVNYPFSGRLQGSMLLAFSKSLDRSEYIELGNILASHFITKLSKTKSHLLLNLEAPEILSKLKIESLFKNEKTYKMKKTYTHMASSGPQVVFAWVMVEKSNS